MSKHKKKSFWGENVSEKSQLNGMEDLIRLTKMVEVGAPLPEVNFEEDDDSSGFNAEVEVGIGDAITRLMSKNNSGAMPEGFNPLTRMETQKEIPEVERISMSGTVEEDNSVVREMEIVEPTAPTPKMMPLSMVTAEDVITDTDATSEDADEEFDYDDSRPLEYGDIQLITTEDDWIYITNAYNMDRRVSICIFNLRGYNVEKNDMYNLMLRYMPLMIAILAGPALIVKQDDPTFRKFMRSSIDRGINVDKEKFMIFTVENNDNKMFIVYVIDQPSREGWFSNFLPPLVENNEETDFFTQVAGLVLNPMINPYGMTETNWPGDRAAEEIDNPEKVEEFCNLMMKELGIEPVESSKTSYTSADSAFKKKSVIGDIQKFLQTVKIAKEKLEEQMNPDNYVEKFLNSEEEEVSNSTDENTTQETPAVVTPPAEKPQETDTTGLFDGVGEDVTVEEVSTPEPPKTEPAPEQKPTRPPKAGADGKKSSKKFEIPVQR